jgi:hypothetical protein
MTKEEGGRNFTAKNAENAKMSRGERERNINYKRTRRGANCAAIFRR